MPPSQGPQPSDFTRSPDAPALSTCGDLVEQLVGHRVGDLAVVAAAGRDRREHSQHAAADRWRVASQQRAQTGDLGVEDRDRSCASVLSAIRLSASTPAPCTSPAIGPHSRTDLVERGRQRGASWTSTLRYRASPPALAVTASRVWRTSRAPRPPRRPGAESSAGESERSARLGVGQQRPLEAGVVAEPDAAGRLGLELAATEQHEARARPLGPLDHAGRGHPSRAAGDHDHVTAGDRRAAGGGADRRGEGAQGSTLTGGRERDLELTTTEQQLVGDRQGELGSRCDPHGRDRSRPSWPAATLAWRS